MIRTLETACNNNISHPSLLHKPFLFLDQAFLYGCILSPKSLELSPYGGKGLEIWVRAFKDESDYKATHSLRRNILLQTCPSTVGMDFIPFLQWMMFCQCL